MKEKVRSPGVQSREGGGEGGRRDEEKENLVAGVGIKAFSKLKNATGE